MMNDENEILEIKTLGPFTTIINHSKYTLIISILPIKPKIKHRDFRLIPKQTFWICEQGLDLTKISFRFEND